MSKNEIKLTLDESGNLATEIGFSNDYMAVFALIATASKVAYDSGMSREPFDSFVEHAWEQTVTNRWNY